MHLRGKALVMRDLLILTAAAFAMAWAVVTLLAPNRIVDGGFTGLAILLNNLLGTPIGVVTLGLTAVAMLAGYFILGPSFGFRTVYATIVYTLAIDFLDQGLHLPPLTHNLNLAVFYGGSIVGASLAAIFYTGGSTGGTDVLAAIIKRFTGLALGRSLLLVDLTIAFTAGLFFGAELLMYSLILIFLETYVIDLILNGIGATKKIWIVSDRWEEIRDAILDLERGVTVFDATGGYTNSPRKLLITYVPRRYVTRLRRLIFEVDPEAFMAIEPVSSVYGEGFISPHDNS